MATWTPEELAAVGAAEELRIAARRADGTLTNGVVIWVVRSGDALYVRSAYGPESAWYRAALARGTGRVTAGGVERDVRFADASGDDHEAIDDAYHEKYDRYGPKIVGTVVGAASHTVTLRLDPVG